MIRSYRFVTSLALLFLLAVTSVNGQWLKDQAVTWTDFNQVHSVASSMSHVYFATEGGITRYNKSEQRWEDPLTGADGFQNEIAKKIWVDQFDSRLYAQTDLGYYQYDILFERWYPVTSLPSIDNSSRHIATPDILLPDFDANYMGGDDFVDYNGRRFSVSDVVDDGLGNLWIGTWGFGAAVARTSTGIMHMMPYGLLQRHVGAMYADDSILWMSGPVYNDYRTGISGFDREKGTFTFIETGLRNDLPAVDINCLSGANDVLYAGTPRGLYVIEKESKMTRRRLDSRNGLMSDNVLSLATLNDALYIGTSKGLCVTGGKMDTTAYVRPETFSGQYIFAIVPDSDAIWIASTVGAYRYTPQNDRLQHYVDPDNILISEVYDIDVLEDEIWFVSRTGVVRLDAVTGDSHSYKEIAGRVDYRAMAVNESICAVTSNFGVTFIFLDSDREYTKEFGVRDGLASNNVYNLLFDGDYLWIGSDEGLTRFWWNNPNRVD